MKNSETKELPLITLNTSKQADFVRYLFAKREIKELKEENKILKENLNKLEAKYYNKAQELNDYLDKDFTTSKKARIIKSNQEKDKALQNKRSLIATLRETVSTQKETINNLIFKLNERSNSI